MYFLNQRIASSSGNSAMILTVTSNFDITTVTPFFTPGVLDEPVVFTLITSVTNDQNSVIKIIARTFGFVVNTCKRSDYVVNAMN